MSLELMQSGYSRWYIRLDSGRLSINFYTPRPFLSSTSN
jgi:hypothetical protein